MEDRRHQEKRELEDGLTTVSGEHSSRKTKRQTRERENSSFVLTALL